MSAAEPYANGAASGPASTNKMNSSSSSTSSNAASLRQKLPAAANGKALDGARKQASSPIDSSSGKKPAPKAWQGTNPITQRPTGASTSNVTPNGVSKSNTASTKQSQQPTSKTNSADMHAHDRMLYILAEFRGLDASVTLINGEKFQGIFAGASHESAESRIILKMVKRTSSATSTQSNGALGTTDEYIGTGDDHILTFNWEDVIDINVGNVQLAKTNPKAQNGTGSSFRTDAEISGVGNGQERELQRWQPGEDTGHDYSLDVTGIGGWDQFATNEKLYNVRSDYDENLYTTAIDRTNPQFKKREVEAARIAKEIERSEPVNPHVAEERRRNANPDDGLDEEDKYSGVRRDVNPLNKTRPNAYVPPSRRPITSQPTVPGAPFDPAIISSQIARPASNAANNSVNQPEAQKAPSIEPTQSSLDSADIPKAVAAALSTAAPIAPTISVSSIDEPAAPSDAAATNAPATSITALVQRQSTNGGTDDFPRKVLDSFKQFSNGEKLKLQQHQRAIQERNRASARQEKSVKLNDLKKFAENFKLHTSVPADLVPILAKTKEKQKEIVAKAEQQVRDKEHNVKPAQSTPVTSPKVDSDAPEQRATRAPPISGRSDASSGPTPSFDPRQRVVPNFRAAHQAIASPRGPVMTNSRMVGNQSQQRAAALPGPLTMPDLRMTPTGPSQARESGPLSPSSAASTKFNVKAMEFKPNPSASAFMPSPGKASPEQLKRASVSNAVASPHQYFSKDLKPPSERTAFGEAFNPIKRMMERSKEEKKTDFEAAKEAANGGIPQAYRTGPTWYCPEENKDKSFADAFPKSLPSTLSPMHTPVNGGAMAHQHQLPPHLQNVPPQMPSAHQTPRQYPAQPHYMANQHMEDHRMQYASSNSSVQPSPRMGHPSMAYNNQMHAQMQNYPGAMPPFGMNPGIPMRQMPSAQGYGPPGPQMGGHMMAQQPSNGPYMNGMGPQMSMYPSPAPGHVQPHFAGHAQQSAMGGPYAPNARSHAMSHQGSQQGHPQGQIYMGPQGPQMMMPQHPGQMGQIRNFPPSQYQGGPHQGYPMQHRAMSGGGYNNHQMTPRQHHAAPQQGPSNTHAPGDEGK